MNAVLLDERDNVAVATHPILPGERIAYARPGGEGSLTAREDIPIYRKFAVRPIYQGENVLEYGEKIGVAAADVSPGFLVRIDKEPAAAR